MKYNHKKYIKEDIKLFAFLFLSISIFLQGLRIALENSII